ncbi:MAG TPA: alpha/beta hydrolase [Patescibacteria group bacterium]|jgi:pimeloyl-ACP methyl ester carboxylesterase|nr:alpha/beta hydrolase [Patescibacteria group bacterium]
MKTEFVTSKDNTKIAFDKLGDGPAVILVGGAMTTRSDNSALAQLLSPHLTVYNYDRRGRGDSGDTKPFAVEREIEDIEALIDDAGGTAYVYGISSGACLALEAAASLGDKIKKLALYEAPYDEAEDASSEWKTYRSNVEESVAENRLSDAVVLFMKLVGMPDEMITGMQSSPMWPDMEAIAPTLPYDAAAMGNDRSVPIEQAARVKAKALVMDGGASLQVMPFMQPTANKLAKAIPNSQRITIEGQGHDISPEILAPVLVKFFSE